MMAEFCKIYCLDNDAVLDSVLKTMLPQNNDHSTQVSNLQIQIPQNNDPQDKSQKAILNLQS